MDTGEKIALGIVVAGGGALLAAKLASTRSQAWERVSGPPTGDGASWTLDASGFHLVPYLDGKPLKKTIGIIGAGGAGVGGGQASAAANADYVERHRRFAAAVRAEWARRRATLPPDADPNYIDAYSKQLYPIASWTRLENPTLNQIQGAQLIPTDEYGRVKPGQYGSGGGFLDMFGALAKNPLFRVALSAAVIYFTGGAGIAVMGAYSAWEARGQELSLKNLALQAGRAYVVSQCGEACGMAWDFGVGVASGKSYDQAAEDALLKQLTPEQREAYGEGKAAVMESGLVG